MDSNRPSDHEAAHRSASTCQSQTRSPDPFDAYPPVEIARRVERQGLVKARTEALTLFVLAVLAGAFISLGGLFYLVVITDSALGFGMTRLVGGASFSLGLVLVVVAGAELFTGNNLIAMAWASRLITTREVLRNWLIVYAGNVFGCMGTVFIVIWANVAGLGGGAVGETAVKTALIKSQLSTGEAFVSRSANTTKPPCAACACAASRSARSSRAMPAAAGRRCPSWRSSSSSARPIAWKEEESVEDASRASTVSVSTRSGPSHARTSRQVSRAAASREQEMRSVASTP